MRVSVIVSGISIILAASICERVAATPVHHTFRYTQSGGKAAKFKSIAFSPDSKQMAVSAAGYLGVIDVQSGREIAKVSGSPHTIGYSADGKRIFTVSQDKSRLIDVGTRSPTKSTPRHSGIVPGYIGFVLERINGKLLITSMNPHGPVAAIGKIAIGDELIGISEGRSGTMRVVTGQSVTDTYKQLGGAAGTFVGLKILPKGSFRDEEATIYTVRRLRRQKRRDGTYIYVDSKASTSENFVSCIVAGRHQLRSASTGTTIAQFQPIDIENNGRIAISPDRSLIAILAPQKLERSIPAVEVFDVATQQRVALMPIPKDSFFDLAFTHDSKFVLVATWDSVEVADVHNGRFVSVLDLDWQPPVEEPEQSETSNNISSISGAVRREIESGGERVAPARSPHNLARRMAVSPKGIVATADKLGHIRLWDLTGFAIKEMPENPQGIPRALEFSPDGNWLAYHVAGILHLVDISAVEPLSTEDSLARLANLTESRPDDIVLQKRTWLALTRAGRTEEANDLLNEIDQARLARRERFVESKWDSRDDLDLAAWRFTLGAHPKNLELARRAAERGYELDKHGDDPDIADTLAHIHYAMGNIEEAIAIQREAVARSSDKVYARRLESFQVVKAARLHAK